MMEYWSLEVVVRIKKRLLSFKFFQHSITPKKTNKTSEEEKD
jgi:hypothetical protein